MNKDDEEEYEVEKILRQRRVEEREQFLVKWKNWTTEHNSWVWREDLCCPDLLAKFLRKNSKPNSNYVSKRSISAAENKLALTTTSSVKRKWEEKSSTDNDEDKADNLAASLQMADEKFSKYLSTFLNQFGGSWKQSHTKRGKFEINYVGHLIKEQIMQSSRKKIEQFEHEITKICAEKKLKPITVENEVDNAVPPQQFTFTLDCIWSKDVTVDKDAVIGCTCRPFCSAKSKECCPDGMFSDFAYKNNGKLRILPGKPIFECNKRCSCDVNCANRTVQRGRQYKLCIYRTKNGRGWGVKAMEKIKKDCFVMEYVGEIITNDEADRRYAACGAEYLFDLDFFESKPDYVIDATNFGNESHFVNHSCDPNMAVYSVYIDHLEVRLPRIALFATKDIEKGEELTFDYAMTAVENQNEKSDDEDGTLDSSSSSLATSRTSDSLVFQKIKHYAQQEGRKRTNGQVKCLCGAAKCRGFVFLDKKCDEDANS